MYRNLSNRVEVLTPIKDQKLKTHLRDVVLSAYLEDNLNARHGILGDKVLWGDD